MNRILMILSALVLGAIYLVACSPASEPSGSATPLQPTASSNPTGTQAQPSLPAGATQLPDPSSTQTAEATQPGMPALTESPAFVASFPNPDSYTWAPVATGLESPVGIAHAGDTRLFILERSGRIRILQDGALVPEPFLDITDRVRAGGERGLLGLAFHPRYPETGTFFVNFTDQNGHTHIAQFNVRADNPNLVDASSEKQILYVEQPYPNHNGGALAFGPDGYLYIGLGDGGSGGDPLGYGQNLEVLLGKVLRIDIDQGDPYAIPTGNPFATGGGRPEIWAYGLRNPWRFAFDRLTSDFYIGDVGQNIYEEIDFQSAESPGGENYGWNILEGDACYGSGNCQTAGLTMPIYTYTHAEAGCSVTGGVVYRGQSLPEWQGIYLFGDYCSGLVGGLLPSLSQGESASWQQAWLFNQIGNISTFGEDSAGEVYLADLNGTIYQLARR